MCHTVFHVLHSIALGRYVHLRAAQPAELIVENASIHTVNPAASGGSQAVAVRGGRIAALGEPAKRWLGAHMRQIDANGATLIPGLIDSHGHIARLSARSYKTFELEGN